MLQSPISVLRGSSPSYIASAWSRPVLRSRAPRFLLRPGSISLRPASTSTSIAPLPTPSSSDSSDSSSSSSSSYSSFRSNLSNPITLVLIIAPLLTGYLGVWQIQRLRWKVALIEEIDRNLAKDPMILPGTINLSALPDFAFRRVLVRGKLTGPPILVGPQVLSGTTGYHLILPLDRSSEGGTTILLNCGFITTAHAQAIREGKAPVPGLSEKGGKNAEIVVEGMLVKRDSSTKSMFTPENQPERNEWFWKDVEEMVDWVEKQGGEQGKNKNIQPVLIDAIDHGEHPVSLLLQRGEPVGRPAHIELRNQHMTYAITWFALCAATSTMLVLLLRRGGKLIPPRRRAFGEPK